MERADVVSAKAELRELKLQHAQVLGHARHDGNRRDLEPVAIEQAENDAVVNLEVLDECRALGQRLANRVERADRRCVQV